VGTIVTLVASLAPARRATRIPPLAAMREEAAAAPPPSRRRRIFSWVLLIGGAAAILFALFGGAPASQALSMLGIGAIALFIAVALLSPRLVPLIAGAVGYPLERLRGVAGRLARENAMRNPGRTAVTAAALMIGLALVTFVSILAAGVKSSIDDTVDNRMRAELVVLNNDGNFTPISNESVPAIKRVPGVQVVSPLRSSQAKFGGVSGKPFGSGIDPPTFNRIWDLKIKEGPPNQIAALTPGKILLETDFADANSLNVGDTLDTTTPIGRHPKLKVTGIFEDKSGLVGDWAVTDSVITTQFGQRDDDLQFIGVQPGADVGAVQDRVASVLDRRFPIAEVQNRSEFKDSVTGGIDQFLTLIYALLSLSVIVSLFGIVNTLVLSIHERTRELGMMRAIGTSRKLVRRIVRYESVITALIGAALGLTLGFIPGVVTTVALKDEGFLLSIPVLSLIVFAILAVIAGVLAAIPPARRASRLNVLDALAYE
jgi:putative ABC transport system permease protein